MELEDRIKKRLLELIFESQPLTCVMPGMATDESGRGECSAWFTSVQNLAHVLFQSPSTPYRLKIDSVIAQEWGYRIHEGVGELAAILKCLMADLEAGLLSSMVDQVRAETFDEFLDHATAYADQRRKNEAGVISGVVFEDALRRVCRKQGIVEQDVKLDKLISDLSVNGSLSPVKARRARVAAQVRTKATHAQWDEYDIDDVLATIAFTRELISAHLDS